MRERVVKNYVKLTGNTFAANTHNHLNSKKKNFFITPAAQFPQLYHLRQYHYIKIDRCRHVTNQKNKKNGTKVQRSDVVYGWIEGAQSVFHNNNNLYYTMYQLIQDLYLLYFGHGIIDTKILNDDEQLNYMKW